MSVGIVDALRNKRREGCKRFQELAERIASGKKIDEAEAGATLAASGRAVADLEKAVADFNRASELRQTIAAAETDLAKQRESRDNLPDASALLAEARRLEAAGNKAVAQHQGIALSIHGAEKRLRELKARLAELQGESDE